MEYVYKINIFGLKMMVKSGLEKIFLKFRLFQKIFFITEFALWAQKCKFSNKNDTFCAWRDFKKKFVIYICTYIK
jgi:hypothetical protein